MNNLFGFRRCLWPAVGCGLGLLLRDAHARQDSPSRQTAPDQAHVMSDVSWHFGNLWFAVQKQNWPLADYFLAETRSHLQWAVNLQPTHKTSAGTEVDLAGILQAVDGTMLAEVAKAIESKDTAKFEKEYKLTLVGCYACHTAVEKPFLRLKLPDAPGALLIDLNPPVEAAERVGQPGDANHGKVFFQQNCALCHSVALGPGNTVMAGQGPSLLGVVGRHAATSPNFHYSKALTQSGRVWDAAALDHFLSNPMADVPGTTMLVPVPGAGTRRDLMAYLATVTVPGGVTLEAAPAPPGGGHDPGDWHNDAPGVKHKIDLAALPAPFATASAGNGPQVVPRPTGAHLSVPPGFKVRLFAEGLSGPRLTRVAPNGDIFIAETGARRIRVLRAADGAEAPAQNEIFADDLDRPFGIAFYPSGKNPKWIYVANNNSVVRFPYQNGDLKARGAAEVVLPKLAGTTGGHTTRDVTFSKDGRRMFVSDGSGSNIAEEMRKMEAEAIRQWESERGLGATWGPESNRANILVTDPDGRKPLRPFATGIRNGVGMLIDKDTGELWVATNERDGLGDDLVPDYITHVKEGGYYGWPWYYMGNHEDPRHAGERPDLAGKATVPDVPVQAHSAALEITEYSATSGAAAFPAEYRGDLFACFHGSWNRASRTGYKVVRVRRHHGAATGEYDDFLTGFVVDASSVWGRPVGVAVARDGALLVTEDGNSTMWRISPAGAPVN